MKQWNSLISAANLIVLKLKWAASCLAGCWVFIGSEEGAWNIPRAPTWTVENEDNRQRMNYWRVGILLGYRAQIHWKTIFIHCLLILLSQQNRSISSLCLALRVTVFIFWRGCHQWLQGQLGSGCCWGSVMSRRGFLALRGQGTGCVWSNGKMQAANFCLSCCSS